VGELIGYANSLSVEAGAVLDFHVSTTEASYEATMTRLIHGDENPAGPGFKEEVDPSFEATRHRGQLQQAHCGSYAISAPVDLIGAAPALTLHLWVKPTLEPARRLGLLTSWSEERSEGLGMFVEEEGDVSFRVGLGDGRSILCRTSTPLPVGAWSSVAGSYDARTGVMAVRQKPQGAAPVAAAALTQEPSSRAAAAELALVVAAYGGDDAFLAGHFNGKIDRPAIFRRALGEDELSELDLGRHALEVSRESVFAAWDFAADQKSTRIADSGGGELHLETVNGPSRAVTGFNWSGTEVDHRQRPSEYGAIHFHEDDLDDARWDVDFSWTIPPETRSGVYAARLRSAGLEDHIPFVVRPAPGAPRADILVVLPTFTYLAYANERLVVGDAKADAPAGTPPTALDPADAYLQRHPELGLSMYDTHSDGSPCIYSSRLRPIPNMRPRYRFWCTGAPERFAADLYLIDWLEQIGRSYDVVTDDDLHEHGRDLLDPYSVVLTGTHPEYCTSNMVSAIDAYLNGGGRLMYLGGNGFYWVTSVDERQSHIVELRRGFNGTRSWESEPGEGGHGTTGEPGGLWRYRGLAPNRLVGVGFTAQTRVPAPGAGYVRCDEGRREELEFIFEGVPEGEVIGEFGLIGDGAAGYEIDRLDYDRGTPPHAVRLATSEGRHSPLYLLAVEDQLSTDLAVGGDVNPLVRSDLVYLSYPEDGAVFSVGSCNWCASLSHDGYSNSVARITENVLKRFCER
jgi:N,N-dimethylformamidase